MRDLIMGVSKAFVFGILIVFISCHKGLTTKEGRSGSGAGHDGSGGGFFACGFDFEFLPDDGAEYCLSGGIPIRVVAAAVTGGRHGKDSAAETAAATIVFATGKITALLAARIF